MAEGDTSWEIPFLNETLYELDCLIRHLNTTLQENGAGCNSSWDHLSCWPPTARGNIAVVPCVDTIRGVPYDTSQNVTRLCQEDGTWANKSDYSHCKPLFKVDDGLQDLWDLEEASTVYYVGYGISLVTLVIALWIFLYFKDLRCLRNTIHTNLLVTFTLMDLTWIVTSVLKPNPVGESDMASCILVVFLTYLMATNFFWMFVEGLYLYILVVKTFSLENVKFYVYAFIGWGIPAVVMTTWAIVKWIFANNSEGLLDKQGCPWQNRDNYDYIFICPVILILLINIFFLCEIMWVLITKLRATTSIESKQYRKAAKALLVLLPLLGTTYVVVLVTPGHRTARLVFSYLQAALLSTQGFTVSVLYCFINAEVRTSLRHHLERWKTRRSLSGPPDHRNSLVYRYSLSIRGEDRASSGSTGIRPDLSSFCATSSNNNVKVNGGSTYSPVTMLHDDDEL